MKYIQHIFLFFIIGLTSCKKVIDLVPQSNLNSATYYSTVEEFQAGLTGVYSGLQRTMNQEWQLTELRSDNTKMGVSNSTSSVNRDYSDLDMFFPASTHQTVYTYWANSYNNIRNCNIIIERLGVKYDPATSTINLVTSSISINDSVRKQIAGEAMFLRAYQYFNLVRLYGGVFLIHKPITAEESKIINRSSIASIYKFIESDLSNASTFLSQAKYAQITASLAGKANRWAAKGLLAKVYLTQNKKADAITLLQDIIANSGFGLQSTYAGIFSTSNELNNEILFTIRYKAGGLGLGSSFGNDFGPLNSGSAVINGSGLGNNYPTDNIDTALLTTDLRRLVNLGVFGSGTAAKLYVKKYLTPVVLTGDGESDWPVLRYADILLMLAEAQGFTPSSVLLINSTRIRAGLPILTTLDVFDIATFESALSVERRLEFAFENQRFFDLVRFKTTLTTITAEQVIKNQFAREYVKHYSQYPTPALTLAQLQANVTSEHLLLPIPQHEIDTNTQLVIPQNPGY